MSSNYKQLFKILEKWPLDKSKAGRDLGESLRSRLTNIHNPVHTATVKETNEFLKQIESLERVCKNIYYTKYRRIYSSTATGLNAQQCSQVLSSEFLHYLNDTDKIK